MGFAAHSTMATDDHMIAHYIWLAREIDHLAATMLPTTIKLPPTIRTDI
jgi:hypothetical protein